MLSSLKEAGLTINEDLSSLVYQGTAEVSEHRKKWRLRAVDCV